MVQVREDVGESDTQVLHFRRQIILAIPNNGADKSLEELRQTMFFDKVVVVCCCRPAIGGGLTTPRLDHEKDKIKRDGIAIS